MRLTENELSPTCPYCGHKDDHWDEALILGGLENNVETHQYKCDNCGKRYKLLVYRSYLFDSYGEEN